MLRYLSLSIALLLVFSTPLSAQNKKKRKPSLKFSVQLLHKDNNEGAAVGDIDGDGKLDISAGEYWYQQLPAKSGKPEFKQYPVRKLLPFGKDYLDNNGEHLMDIDGDGDLDVLAGTFKATIVYWYENPGSGKYDVKAWNKHTFLDTETAFNETSFLHDIDDDGKVEFIENNWNAKMPMQIIQLKRSDDGKMRGIKHVISDTNDGHGMGFGDINGDGKQDIVGPKGWYEQPKAGPYASKWQHHADIKLPHASCPLIVTDLNGDGRNDILWADGHNYGVYWEEQLKPRADGTTVWRQHLIGKKFSQGHALAWVDIDNDGKPELITGKRYYGHSGRDPGANDEITVHFYDWNATTKTWKRFPISNAPAGKGPGIGLQIRVADLDGDGWKDLVVPGKTGTYVIWNHGK